MTSRAGAPAPWSADRELTRAQAGAAIGSQFPELAALPVAPAGVGWDHDVYRVGEWMFRFPRRRVVAEDQPREIAVLALAAEALAGTGIRVPVVEKQARPCEHFPYPFTGARRIEGVPLDRVARLAPAAARALGAALGALHALDRPRWAGLGLERERRDAGQRLAQLVARRDEVAGLLPPALAARCAPWLEGAVVLPPEPATEPHPIHDDLGADHVLVDPATGRIAGLLDFADAALGDAALDLAGLVAALGPAPVEAVASGWWKVVPAARRDPNLRPRAVFLGRVMALLWLADAARAGDGRELDRHRLWVRRAFAPAPS